jgi:hypothetical protein
LIKILEQSYQSNFFYPRPEVHFDAENGLCIVAFPWGSRSVAKKTIEYIIDFFHSTQNDQEVTSPFEKLASLSPMANNIRVALMLANDMIYKEENSEELLTGLEVAVIAQDQSQIVIGQIGAPSIYLARGVSPLVNISSYFDLSASAIATNTNLRTPPLPATLLGTHANALVTLNSFKPQTADKIILSTLNTVPTDLNQVAKSNYSFKNLVDHLVNKQPDQGFWLGQINF